MSRVTRHKHVMKELMDDDYKLPKEEQEIVRVIRCRGNNLQDVENAKGETFLVSMPTKFRQNLWLKRGDYLLVDPIKEGVKVKAEISRILTPEHVKEYTKAGIWPKAFTKKREQEDVVDGGENYGDDMLTPNRNRPHVQTMEDTDTDTECSSEEN